MANSAPTPYGYASVFTNVGASLQASNYMGLYTLTSYDTLGCASKCDQASGCAAFNVFLERDPTLNANAVNCPNPPSTTNYKCTLWGAPVSSDEATNSGQYQDSFQVVIAGSNGWFPHIGTSIHPSNIHEQPTTRTHHPLLSAATMVPKNSVERSMLQPTPAATWATNSFPSAKAKASILRLVRMLAMLKPLTTASIPPLTAASCHAYVFYALLIQCGLSLTMPRYSSTPTCFRRTVSRRVSTAPCTTRPGDPRTAITMASTARSLTVQLIATPYRIPTATPRARK